jgi:hypothetical protein
VCNDLLWIFSVLNFHSSILKHLRSSYFQVDVSNYFYLPSYLLEYTVTNYFYLPSYLLEYTGNIIFIIEYTFSQIMKYSSIS